MSVALPKATVLPRLWNVTVHCHADASFTARIWADGKVLRPECAGCSTEAVLSYAGAALADVQPGDQLTLRIQGRGGGQTCRAPSASAATRWLEQHLCMGETVDS